MKVYNTLSAKKEDFVPREKDKIGIYVCGPTVYNYIHIGNARAYVSFDTIIRYLKHKGLKVKYVRNLTDVDDKIIKRAAEENTTTEAITDKYTKAFHRDMKALGVQQPTIEPKATEHIKEMIETIEKLIERDMAYVVDGDVYFSVEKFQEYGKLSKRTIEEMLSGARVDVDERKKHPADFALWKKAKEGEPSWPSPWGDGRPGWHIECSTMSMKYLGMGFDIHGGGQDLIFPHHENEIAQAEGATGQKPFVKYWLHNGFLSFEEAKMAKSVGNVILIKDLEEQYKDHIDDLRNDLRMLFISAHYHSHLNFSQKKLKEAAAARWHIQDTLNRILTSEVIDQKETDIQEKDKIDKLIIGAKDSFIKAMDNDFNTPITLSSIFDLLKDANTFLDNNIQNLDRASLKSLKKLADVVFEITNILGFKFTKPRIYKEDMVGTITLTFQPNEEILTKISNIYEDITGKDPKNKNDKEILGELFKIRAQARRDKDFSAADKIRQKMAEAGFEIHDSLVGLKLTKK